MRRKYEVNSIIDECVNKTMKKYLLENSILYRNYDDAIKRSDWIWLSSMKNDVSYGKNEAVFSIPLEEFKIADRNTVIRYIKKYDISCFADAIDDELIDRWYDSNNYKLLQNGEISEEEAYDRIPIASWTEIMEYPQYYTFSNKLKEDGYDGYCFEYLDLCFGNPMYYAFFDGEKILPYMIK